MLTPSAVGLTVVFIIPTDTNLAVFCKKKRRHLPGHLWLYSDYRGVGGCECFPAKFGRSASFDSLEYLPKMGWVLHTPPLKDLFDRNQGELLQRQIGLYSFHASQPDVVGAGHS